MDRGDKIVIGAVAGVVVAAGVVRRRLRANEAEQILGPEPKAERDVEPERTAERARIWQTFLDSTCESCGVQAGIGERQATRIEQRVVLSGANRNREPQPVLLDDKVLYTYHACRNCGATRQPPQL